MSFMFADFKMLLWAAFCVVISSIQLTGADDLYFNVDIRIVNKSGHVATFYRSVYNSHSGELRGILRGLIVMANPPNACERIDPPHFFTNGSVARFVLINSTLPFDCSSTVKAQYAEVAGFDLAVIYGDNPWPLAAMYKSSNIHIPVLFLSYSDGIDMRENYLFDNRSLDPYFVKVYPPGSDISYYIMLFAIVIGVCLVVMLFFIICLLVKCVQARRHSMRNRLSSRQIRQLPTETFKRGDQYDVCAICLEEYKEGEKLRILPCSHAYHTQCIDPWLSETRRNCPLCKRKVRFGNSTSDSESESEMTSTAEDTPLIGPVSERMPSWGTFCQDSTNQTEVAQASASPSHYNDVAAEDCDFESCASVSPATGSINSCDGASVEYSGCDRSNTENRRDHLV